jgi:hypothetical protein
MKKVISSLAIAVIGGISALAFNHYLQNNSSSEVQRLIGERIPVKFAGQTDPYGNPIQVPAWVFFIVFLQLFYYATFGYIQARHISARLSGKPYNFSSTEHSYIGLSYFSKLSLAGGIGYGLLFRTKDCPV